MKPRIGKVLYTEDEIEARLDELAAQIEERYRGGELTVVAVLKGSLFFCADLARRRDMPVRVDILEVSSYFDDTQPQTPPVLSQYLVRDVAGHNVLIVDDIIETGSTLKKVVELLEEERPKSLSVCVFLDKTLGRRPDVRPDFRGFVMTDDVFVVGYGLDYNQRFRNLSYLAALELPKPATRTSRKKTTRKKKPAGKAAKKKAGKNKSAVSRPSGRGKKTTGRRRTT